MYTSGPNPLLENSVLDTKVLDPDYLFREGSTILEYIFSQKALDIYYIILSVIAILCIAVIIYTTIRMFEVRAKEHGHVHHEIEEYKHNQSIREKKAREAGVFKNERWKKVLDYLFSGNSNDWKLAVIEADSMLFNLVTQLGFKGDTLGDKLKNANRDNFRSLSAAWEAHNVRNKIAHEGSSFEFSHHEAKMIISLYEKVFLEFGYI